MLNPRDLLAFLEAALVFAVIAALRCRRFEFGDIWPMYAGDRLQSVLPALRALAPENMLRRTPRSALAAIAVLFWAALSGAHAADIESLEIVTKSGVHVFTVELARTEQERETGLMYRKELPEGRGMLFDFTPEQNVQMWMKNTFIPLDMIFIRADGRILRIAENTEPQSEKIIPSGGLAKGVLEVIAGTARKYGIEPGDRVAHPLFGSH